MTREEAKEKAQRVIAKSVAETDPQALAVGDLVYHLCIGVCMKILAIDGEMAVLSDSKVEVRLPLNELAHDEVVRVNTMLEVYGDKVIAVAI